RLVGAALILVVCGACQLTATVAVDAHRDGTGIVRVGVGLDADAARQVPDLTHDLRVDDLRRRGWAIVGPRQEKDGRTWVRAAKHFGSPDELRSVVAEVSGPSGPFRDFRLQRSRSFFRSRLRFTGTVDLSGGV